MLNVICLMGRLVRDPELRHTPNGIATCTFTLAVDRSFARQGEERKADFIDVVAWRQTAEFVCKYFRKGSLMAINGSLQTRSYQDKNGNKRTAWEVVADNINFAGGKPEQRAEARPTTPEPYDARVWGHERPVQTSAEDFAVIDGNEDLPFD